MMDKTAATNAIYALVVMLGEIHNEMTNGEDYEPVSADEIGEMYAIASNVWNYLENGE